MSLSFLGLPISRASSNRRQQGTQDKSDRPAVRTPVSMLDVVAFVDVTPDPENQGSHIQNKRKKERKRKKCDETDKKVKKRKKQNGEHITSNRRKSKKAKPNYAIELSL